MIKTGWLGLISLVVISLLSLLAQEPAEEETVTSIQFTDQLEYKVNNGKTWRRLDHQSRIMWVRGIEEGTCLWSGRCTRMLRSQIVP
jgi:hypothetical protein